MPRLPLGCGRLSSSGKTSSWLVALSKGLAVQGFLLHIIANLTFNECKPLHLTLQRHLLQPSFYLGKPQASLVSS